MKNIFPNGTIYNDRVTVNTLEAGAIEYGGATMIGDYIYSNIDTGDDINVYEVNRYGIIVPSTVDIDVSIDNTEYVKTIKQMLSFISDDMESIEVKGSWYSTTLQKVIIEDNIILTFNSDKDSDEVLQYLRVVADYLKCVMTQEAVSIVFNEGLIII